MLLSNFKWGLFRVGGFLKHNKVVSFWRIDSDDIIAKKFEVVNGSFVKNFRGKN